MSNRLYAKIQIFGEVPKALLEKLYELLEDEGFDGGESSWEDKTDDESYEDWFKKMCKELGYLDFSDSQARYGEFEDLEKFLDKNHIIYTRTSEGDGGECFPEVIYFDGKNKICQKTDDRGDPTLSIGTIRDLLDTAIKMEKEIKDGNAPLFINTKKVSHEESVMAKFALGKKGFAPSAIELAKTYLDVKYPAIPTEGDLPFLTII